MPQRGKEGKFLSRALQSPNSRYENTLAMFALAAEDEVPTGHVLRSLLLERRSILLYRTDLWG
ncbi:MAG: hypothetical protein L6R36_004441 [Xanthoria steineri]|nr:MAG: hypothetical protein L6R36_004441 [Xanthoria steineri]